MTDCKTPVSGGWQSKQNLTLLPDLTGASGGWQRNLQSLTILPDLAIDICMVDVLIHSPESDRGPES